MAGIFLSSPSIGGAVDAGEITAGSIVNADISASAAIAYSKLAAPADGSLISMGSDVALKRSAANTLRLRNAGDSGDNNFTAGITTATGDLIGRSGQGSQFKVDATGVGFFNQTPVARAAAITQTYSTAARTHSNPTGVAVTDNSGGTANTTLEAISAVPTQAEIRNNFADLAAQHNAVVADLANVKQVLNAVVDDLQAYGLEQ